MKMAGKYKRHHNERFTRNFKYHDIMYPLMKVAGKLDRIQARQGRTICLSLYLSSMVFLTSSRNSSFTACSSNDTIGLDMACLLA